jgi:hypothetical protein
MEDSTSSNKTNNRKTYQVTSAYKGFREEGFMTEFVKAFTLTEALLLARKAMKRKKPGVDFRAVMGKEVE